MRKPQNQERQRLEALHRYGALDTEPELAFDRIVALASKVFGVPVALIGLIDHDRQWFKACYGLGLKELDPKVSFCTHTIRSGAVMVVPDARQDSRFARNPLVTGDPQIRFYAGAPLKTSDGFTLGTLCLIGTEPNPAFGQAQREQLADFAAIVGGELELRRADRALRASETRYRVVAETASDAIVTVGEDGRIRYVNAAAGTTFGYAREELRGQNLSLLIPNYLRALHEAAFRRYLETGERQLHWAAIEFPGLHKEGREIALEISFGEHHEGSRRFFTGIMRDVTERKQAAEAQARTAALLRAAFDATAEGILSVDEDGRITNYNRRYLDIWRIPDEVIALEDDEALVQHALAQAKNPDGFLERIRATYGNPEAETKDTFELRDGRILERVSLPQRMGEGSGERIVGRVWSFRDVTAWHRAERHLHELNEGLEVQVGVRTAELVAAKTELERMNAQLAHDALHDKLTGLPNRTLFLDRLGLVIERSQRYADRRFAVLLIDADRFKVVNDSLGRVVGDTLLVGLGERLARGVRPGDTVARLGEDEFAVLLEDLAEPCEAEQVAMRFKEEVRKPFLVDGQPLHLSISIGIVLGYDAAYDDTGYEGAEGVLRDAGIAVNRAKALGRARYQLFAAEMRARASSLQVLGGDLHGATERHELRVLYQPIMFLPDGSLAGFEALVRWQHPQLGTVAPAEFIPIAEEVGLIVDIDRWVLREACKQLRRWQRRFPLAPPVAINVNLSSQQFLRPDLVDYVRGVLQETGVLPEQLRLELTESGLMQRSAAVSVVLEQLKALGVELYIDDFGTGYSSLSYLQSFPVDALKIDRSFVTNMTVSPERAELVKTIVTLARTLKLGVVAEGVETEAQRAQLAALGCRYGQGYLFAKPLSAAAAGAFLAAQRKGAAPDSSAQPSSRI